MSQKDTIKRIMKMIKPYTFFLLGSFVFAIVSVALTLYAPILTGNAIDYIIDTGNVDFNGIEKILIQLGIVIIITGIAQWLMNLCNNKITYHIVQDIRNRVFEHLEDLPLKYIDGNSYGTIISRIISDVDQFSDGLLMGFTQLFSGVITIVGTLGFMFSINVSITIVVVVITPISLFVASFIAKRTYSLFRIQSETRGEMTSVVEEMVGNQKVVKAFSYENEAEATFNEINDRLNECGVKALFFSALTNPCTRFVNGLVYAGVGIFGAISALHGRITVGQLSCFLTYANQYTKPFNEISGVVTELQSALASAKRVFDLIDEPEQIPDKVGAIELEQVDGSVKLEHVNFSYNEEVKLIEDLNLTVEPGQRIAIVGPTGCGKTTIINLLMRFYEVNSGHIFVSHHDSKDITRDSLRSNYGMVLQETWLKPGTIAENIAYGKKDATKEEIIEAAKAAHAHGFISRLEDGYDTIISEEGGNISQGQKQLLCIARVMLCLPPMLILDEATSSIDTRTEIRIQKAFQKMMEGRTSFIVAHRLSTIKEADHILVMKDGHIIEHGKHEELLNQKGFYADLYNSQFAN
ncbi:MAG: ABC transporter ATP-binding protein [bacterium]|nr:ABC transporter ATP-binding protein [bacterium]